MHPYRDYPSDPSDSCDLTKLCQTYPVKGQIHQYKFSGSSTKNYIALVYKPNLDQKSLIPFWLHVYVILIFPSNIKCQKDTVH